MPTLPTIPDLPRGLHRFTIGAAWFFILVSLAHLAWVIGVKWSNPAGLVTLYQTSVGDEVYRAWGLAYAGMLGLLLALAQATAVIAATVLSVLPWRRGRRIGHIALVIWSGWWAGNLFALAAVDHQIDSVLQASLLTLLFGCTIYRARSARRKTPPPAPRTEQVADDPPPDDDTDPLFLPPEPVTESPMTETPATSDQRVQRVQRVRQASRSFAARLRRLAHQLRSSALARRLGTAARSLAVTVVQKVQQAAARVWAYLGDKGVIVGRASRG
jgi:hypothetical protein